MKAQRLRVVGFCLVVAVTATGLADVPKAPNGEYVCALFDGRGGRVSPRRRQAKGAGGDAGAGCGGVARPVQARWVSTRSRSVSGKVDLTQVGTVTVRKWEAPPFTVTLADGREVVVTPRASAA